VLCLALAACRVEGGVPRVTPSKAPVAAASVHAASPTPGVAGPVRLAKPASASTTLAGAIVVDAGYIVAQGGGNIVAQGGGNVVTAGPLNTNDGGSLITNDGGSMTGGNGGTTIVAQGGGNIVAQGGGNLITNDGAGVVASDGVTIVAQGGGNIVAQGGGNYRLAAAPAPGTQLPAAGMAVGAYSLTSGRYVPVGVDKAGKPVYTVYSNLQGAYELYVPADAGNVLVVANVPGSRDHRLAFDLLDGAGDRLDEDTAMVTKLLRQLMYGRFQVYIAQAGADGPVQLNSDLDRAFASVTGDFLPRLREAGKRLNGADLASRARHVQRMADLVLPDARALADVAGPVATIRQVMGQLRERAPGFYAGARLAPLVQEARAATDAFNQTLLASQPGVATPYVVPFGFTADGFKKPSDLADFMVRALYSPNAAPLSQLKDGLLRDAGVTDELQAALRTAELGLMVAVGNRLADEQARAAVLAALDAP
jgi:hypothetical protein